jgi:hypothetical protein
VGAFDKFMVAMARLVGLALILGAFCAWAYQLYWYLRHGAWTSLDLMTLWVRYEGSDVYSWALMPQDWKGLHHVLSLVPAPLLALIGGVAVMGAVSD